MVYPFGKPVSYFIRKENLWKGKADSEELPVELLKGRNGKCITWGGGLETERYLN